jgi:hypothetical protein
VSQATVHRVLVRRRLARLTGLDMLAGGQLRKGLRSEHDAPGCMIHTDIKELCRIPAGGGRRAHGRGTRLPPFIGGRTRWPAP